MPTADRLVRLLPSAAWSRRVLAAAAAVSASLAFAPATQAEPLRDDVAQQVGIDELTGESFVRFRQLRNGGVLETGIVTFVNDAGQRVDLIGVVHVGDEVYYDLLNERFVGYDALLYEMVKPKGLDMGNRQQAAGRKEDAPFALQIVGYLQKGMQLALDLRFQTEEIDYGADNFVHADLDLETFTRLQAERGEGFLQMFLDQMMRDLTNPPKPGEGPQLSMFEIMDALDAPDRSRRLKMIFARELGRVDDLAGMLNPEGEGSVILDVRNEKAVEVLDETLAAGVGNVGVFYGAAHMTGIADLLAERGFRVEGEPEFLVAWDMTLDGRAQREMREQVREAIVANAAGLAPGDGDGGNDRATAAAAAMRVELDALRKENEALRRQVEALRQQVEALNAE
jgi:hypothetical protein